MPPSGLNTKMKDMTVKELATYVTRDSMIGVTVLENFETK
jgi:hypothetical protein